MKKINWINGQAGGTPLSAENLNQMQDNIEEAIQEASDISNGTILFENTEGLNDNITLNSSSENFNEIKIDYKVVFTGYTARQSIRVMIADGDNVILQSVLAHTDTLMLFNSARYKVTGDTIVKQTEIGARTDNTGVISFDGTTARTLITKITGYNT